MRQIQPPNNCVNKARIREVAETLVRSVLIHLRCVLAVVNLEGQDYYFQKHRLGFGEAKARIWISM